MNGEDLLPGQRPHKYLSLARRERLREMGIAMDNTTPVSITMNSSEVSNSMYGVYDMDKTTSLVAKTKVAISSSKFTNNVQRHIYINNAKGTLPSTSSINGNTFSANPTHWKKPLTASNAYADLFTSYGISLLNGDFTNAAISNNTIGGAFTGIHTVNASVLFKGNTVNTCYSGLEVDNYYVPATSTTLAYSVISSIQNNTINLHQSCNGVDGLYGVFLSGGQNFTNNTINGSTNSSSTQIGIVTTTAGGTISGNTISGTSIGISTYDAINGEVSSNTITNARTSILLNPNTYSVPTISIRCNTFDNTGLSGNNYGIYVAPGSFLHNLGGDGTPVTGDIPPNGNRFKFNNDGNSFPLDYNGDKSSYSSFKYYRYNSSQEIFNVTSSVAHNPPSSLSNITNGNINTGISANANTCAGTPGISARVSFLTIQDSVTAIMDSLRFQLGDHRKMKEWQVTIVSYHLENNKLSDLESYTDSLLGCNMEAYNSLSLYLMNQYHGQGQCSYSHVLEKKIIANNTGDREINARTKYFEYQCRQTCDTSHLPYALPDFTMNLQDSTDLAFIASSGATQSQIACMKLKAIYPDIDCNGDTNTYVPVYPDCGPECKKKRTKFLKKGWVEQTGVKAKKQQAAQLSQNIPNPAENETLIPYFIPESENTNLENTYIIIRNIIDGSEVKRVVLTKAGYRVITVTLDELPSNVYSYSLIVNGINIDVKRMVVVK